MTVPAMRQYPFELDRFQREAINGLDAGRHVIVAAPTGSGKTVVAEHGVDRALSQGKRAFYTAPIKALSNQKYRDLVQQHGDATVGLLTGDNAVNPDAPVVVMTTEVLRNMIYGRRRALADLAVVVLDEVHFLQDAYRGPVWEEVIIHLPHHVQLVCLSATVSNAGELAEWVGTVRGPTDAVVEERRPVRLDHHYLVGDRTDERLHLLPVFVDGRPNDAAMRLDASAVRGRRSGPRERPARGSGRRILSTPGRLETVQLLDQRSMLPVIFFIFSRNQCDEAARSCLESGLVLTDEAERERIRAIAGDRLDGLDTTDLAVLGYPRFMAQLEAGVAAHHAGMIPPFKEVVEACFVEGLTKVVFATETLAVGINMPARSVVIEKLTKFTGEHHEQLTAGQYTQLIGRAGRRGIDELGHAVVAWSPFVGFDQVAELAGSRSFHLRSVFRPTYNMAANLVRTYGDEEAHHLLNLSFAQFQSNRDVVRLEARLERQRAKAARLRDEAQSPFGDIDDFRRSRDPDVSAREIEDAMSELRPGALIRADLGKYRGPVAVVATASRKAGHRLTVVTPNGDSHQLLAADLDGAPVVVGTIALPPQHAPGRRDYRRDVGRRIKSARIEPRSRDTGRGARRGMHPVEADPELKMRLQAAGRADRVEREITDLERRVGRHQHSLAAEFDTVLGVLADRGYVDREAWEITDAGEMLAHTFHESDLLVTECLRLGLLDGLDAADVAGLTSMFVYEHRSPDDPPRPWYSSGDTAERARRIAAVSTELRLAERAAGLAEHRAPDPTFFAIAYAWVAGEGFAEVVDVEEMTGGDFVRTTRQLIDLLGQLARMAPDPATRRAAAVAADAAFRDVVADSSRVATERERTDGDREG